MKKPKEPKPLWTVKSKAVNLTEKMDSDGKGTGQWVTVNKSRPSYWEHRLRFEGKTVHTLQGGNGLVILTRQAEEFNRNSYQPTFNGTKLLQELSASKRRELDDLCAKSVPDLFSMESEVKA